MNETTIKCETPAETFAFGERLGSSLVTGDIILLYGGLGTGKTLLTKGILNSLDFDIDEVTSPSFSLVNLYQTDSFDVYHIDLWRLDGVGDAAGAVGLSEILDKENAVTIVEWADRLGLTTLSPEPTLVRIEGDGDDVRRVYVKKSTATAILDVNSLCPGGTRSAKS